MASGWRLEERRGAAATLHASWPGADRSPGRRTVAHCRVARPAVVLGSTQPTDVVDAARASRRGVEVARRRSGGGAVLVAPGEPLWIDLWVPSTDPLWRGDVGHAFDWVGDTWVAALGQLGVPGPTVHRSGPVACTRWSRQVCFGGIGRGEVMVEGRKVVGLAQRRTRAGAWFHCACALRWEAGPLVDLLALTATERAAARRDLAAAATGVADLRSGGAVLTDDDVAAALLGALPTGPS